MSLKNSRATAQPQNKECIVSQPSCTARGPCGDPYFMTLIGSAGPARVREPAPGHSAFPSKYSSRKKVSRTDALAAAAAMAAPVFARILSNDLVVQAKG